MSLVSVVLSMIEDNTTLMSSGPANQMGIIAQPHFLGRCSLTVCSGWEMINSKPDIAESSALLFRREQFGQTDGPAALAPE